MFLFFFFLFDICAIFPGALGSFLALAAAGYPGGPLVHNGASLAPGWAPWRMLWAYEDAKSGK